MFAALAARLTRRGRGPSVDGGGRQGAPAGAAAAAAAAAAVAAATAAPGTAGSARLNAAAGCAGDQAREEERDEEEREEAVRDSEGGVEGDTEAEAAPALPRAPAGWSMMRCRPVGGFSTSHRITRLLPPPPDAVRMSFFAGDAEVMGMDALAFIFALEAWQVDVVPAAQRGAALQLLTRCLPSVMREPPVRLRAGDKYVTMGDVPEAVIAELVQSVRLLHAEEAELPILPAGARLFVARWLRAMALCTRAAVPPAVVPAPLRAAVHSHLPVGGGGRDGDDSDGGGGGGAGSVRTRVTELTGDADGSDEYTWGTGAHSGGDDDDMATVPPADATEEHIWHEEDGGSVGAHAPPPSSSPLTTVHTCATPPPPAESPRRAPAVRSSGGGGAAGRGGEGGGGGYAGMDALPLPQQASAVATCDDPTAL